MKLPNQTAANLLNKDKNKSLNAAQNIINNKDIEAWQCLIEHSEFIFDFIKDKAGKNLLNAINKDNLDNLFELLKTHSPDWDFYIAKAFANNSNESLNNRFLELLKTGTDAEKSYAAKYFELIKYQPAGELLFTSLKTDYAPLKTNIAKALGAIEDQNSFEHYLEKLNSNDDWDKVEAAEFLSAYGNKEAIFDMLEAMSNSSMADCIAAEIATLDEIYKYFTINDNNLKSLAFEAFDHLISGLADVWSLGVIFDFKVYECIDTLINLANQEDNEFSGRIAQLLLKTKAKMTLFLDNDQYTYGEDKNTITELQEINGLLLSQYTDFWNKQVNLLENELNQDCTKRKLATLSLIKELKLTDYSDKLISLTETDNQSDIVYCEAITAIKALGMTCNIISNKDSILSKIKDETIRAIIENTLLTAKK